MSMVHLRPYLGLALIVALTFALGFLPFQDVMLAGVLSGGAGMLSAHLLARRRARLTDHAQSNEPQQPPWVAPWQHPSPHPRSTAAGQRARSIPMPPWRQSRLAGVAVQARTLRRLLLAPRALRMPQPARLVPPLAQLRPHLSLHSVPQIIRRREQAAPPRAATLPPAVVVTALAGTVEEAIERSGSTARIAALHHAQKGVQIELAVQQPLTSAQRRSLKQALEQIAPSARWASPERLWAPLPTTLAPDTPRSLCLPLLRHKRGVIWWPLRHTPHLILAGDATLTLAAQLGALQTQTTHQPLTFLLHDPHGELRSLPLPHLAATPDALAQTTMHLSRLLWARRQGETTTPPTPVVLIAVAPDEHAWHDLSLLVGRSYSALHVLILLGADVQSAIVRDVCHRLPIVEVGGLGGPALPESYRPPTLPPARAGEVVVWSSAHTHWRGKPLCSDERSLLRSWLPSEYTH